MQVRMHFARKRFLALRAASTTIATRRRGLVQRRRYAVDIQRHRAARTIQAAVRGHQARALAARRLAATTTIQVACKRWHLQRRCARREADMRQALEFAQNRALRAQDKLHSLETQLAEWAAIKEEFQMSADEIRGALQAWREGGHADPEASRALAPAGLSEQDARDLKLFQTHRQAFFAWQMGAGLEGGARNDEESELQVRPCSHRCQRRVRKHRSNPPCDHMRGKRPRHRAVRTLVGPSVCRCGGRTGRNFSSGSSRTPPATTALCRRSRPRASLARPCERSRCSSRCRPLFFLPLWRPPRSIATAVAFACCGVRPLCPHR